MFKNVVDDIADADDDNNDDDNDMTTRMLKFYKDL
jgi:hypothetical protein